MVLFVAADCSGRGINYLDQIARTEGKTERQLTRERRQLRIATGYLAQ